jgi:hypothetical protein
MERDQEGGKGGAWKEKEEQGKTWKMIYMSFFNLIGDTCETCISQ